MKKKGLWKKILLVLLPIAVMVVMALFDPNVADIGEVIDQMDPLWLLAALGSILLYYFCDTMMYKLACRYLGAPQTLWDSTITTMLGFFYSALTPFSTGGQPMQVLQMRRRGIKVGMSTCVLMVKFLCWQLAVTIFGILGFVFIPREAIADSPAMMVMYAVGFTFYLFTVVLALLVLFRPDWVYRVGKRILGFLARWRILKHSATIQRVNETWARTISDFERAITFAFRNVWGMLLIFFVCVVSVIAYMGVTYFIYRGLGFSGQSFWYVVMLQGLLHIAVSFVPLPGASIASEGGFYLVFSTLLSPAARFPAVVLWRLIAYYSALVLGVIFVIIDGLRNPRKPGEEIAPPEQDDEPDGIDPADFRRRSPKELMKKRVRSNEQDGSL